MRRGFGLVINTEVSNVTLSSMLYRAARISRDIGAVSSGNPHRVARRVKNKIVGRALGRAGVWRRLWK